VRIFEVKIRQSIEHITLDMQDGRRSTQERTILSIYASRYVLTENTAAASAVTNHARTVSACVYLLNGRGTSCGPQGKLSNNIFFFTIKIHNIFGYNSIYNVQIGLKSAEFSSTEHFQ